MNNNFINKNLDNLIEEYPTEKEKFLNWELDRLEGEIHNCSNCNYICNNGCIYLDEYKKISKLIIKRTTPLF